MFLADKIFWGGSPKILNGDYQIRLSTDHHAKFHANRPMHLDRRSRADKKSALKHKPAAQAIASGRTKKIIVTVSQVSAVCRVVLLYKARVVNSLLDNFNLGICLLYTSPSPRDRQKSRMPSSA